MTQEPIQNETPVMEGSAAPVEEAPRKKRTLFWLGIGLAAVLVLGGAAFLAGRLFNRSDPATSLGGPVLSNSSDGKQTMHMSSADFSAWPDEIPQTKPDTNGMYVSREDNLLTIGTGNVTVAAKQEQNGEASIDTDYSGPQVEVLVTGDTKLYRDATMDDLTNGITEEGQKIERKIAPGSLDEISENSTVTVWGRKSGDRYVADVLIYSTPFIISRPAR